MESLNQSSSNINSEGTGSMANPSLLRVILNNLWAEISFDWILATLFVILSATTNTLQPRVAFIVEDTLYHIAYAKKDNTVPSWSVPLYSVGFPLLCFSIKKFVYGRKWSEFSRLSAALILSVFLTATITNCIKAPIGRPRPHFASVCWPDGKVTWSSSNQFGGWAQCACSTAEEYEARRSFPSGHTSVSTAGLGFLTLWLLGQLGMYSAHPYCWRLVVALTPLAGAVAVGLSRIVDNAHHPSDVAAGGALGLGIAAAIYFVLYPWFRDMASWEILEEKQEADGNGGRGMLGLRVRSAYGARGRGYSQLPV